VVSRRRTTGPRSMNKPVTIPLPEDTAAIGAQVHDHDFGASLRSSLIRRCTSRVVLRCPWRRLGCIVVLIKARYRNDADLHFLPCARWCAWPCGHLGFERDAVRVKSTTFCTEARAAPAGRTCSRTRVPRDRESFCTTCPRPADHIVSSPLLPSPTAVIYRSRPTAADRSRTPAMTSITVT